jgi:hypothetical protein
MTAQDTKTLRSIRQFYRDEIARLKPLLSLAGVASAQIDLTIPTEGALSGVRPEWAIRDACRISYTAPTGPAYECGTAWVGGITAEGSPVYTSPQAPSVDPEGVLSVVKTYAGKHVEDAYVQACIEFAEGATDEAV